MRNIDPSFLSKLNKHNQTIYGNANPKMSVQVSRAKSTVMDSTYWTVEKIREKEGLGDSSVVARRFKPHGPPNRLYNIYVDNGIVKTSIREYPDYQKEKWQNKFELGGGKAVAIAFNGNWERYRDYWQLVTNNDPFLFWVDNSGKLFTQLWDDAATKIELATSVNKVKAIRGWRNVNFLDKDHGVIAAYIKTNGKVYYRNYCSQLNGTLAWENEREVTEFTGIAINLNLFITNDYRTGIMIEDSLGKVYWVITSRNWAGMAIAPEKFTVGTKAEVDLIPVNYIRPRHDELFTIGASATIGGLMFGRTDNSIAYAENLPMSRLDEDNIVYEDWGFKVRLKVKYKSIITPTFTLTDKNTSSPLSIKTVTEIVEGYEYELLVDDTLLEFGFNIVDGDIMIGVTNFKNEANLNYDIINYDFTPINLVSPGGGIPELELIWNE